MASKVFGSKLDLKVGESAWQHFLTAIEVRNRITHPKAISEFRVSDEEIAIARKVSSWFNEFIAKSVEGVHAGITRSRN